MWGGIQKILNVVKIGVNEIPTMKRMIHCTTINMAEIERNWTYKTLPKKDLGTDGEKTADIDSLIDGKASMFPNPTSNLRLFDGVPFDKLPIINIKATKNNTLMNITKADGKVLTFRTCGIEGFKLARKGTNVAAQATAISFSQKVVEKGIKTVRVRVQGLGAGRMSSIKGLQMGGINIVSITDATRISWNPPRPRKARRV